MTDPVDAIRPAGEQGWWPELLELVESLEAETARASGRPSRELGALCSEIERRIQLLKE